MYSGQILIPWMGHLWLIQKKLINELEQYDAILVLIGRISFPQRDAQERGLTNLHNGGKCSAT